MFGLFRKKKNKDTYKRKSEKTEKRIREIMDKTGWTREYTIDKVEEAKKKVDIKYKEFSKYNFHLIPESEYEEAYQKILLQREHKKRKKEAREKYISEVMECTGWSHDEASANMKEVRKLLGVSYKDYVSLKLYNIAKENVEEEYKKILERREEKRNGKYLEAVVERTGWDIEYAREKMERAMKETGASYEHYLIYRFWELEEEEQKTYFTKRDAVTLRRKYTKDPAVKKLIKEKPLFYQKFDEYLGRVWMKTENMSFEDFKAKFENEKKLMYKPLASSGGHGIEVFTFEEENMEDVYEQLRELPDGIIEGYVVQHPEMQKLSLNSVNTIRIVTVCTNEDVEGVEKNKVNFVYAGVRMGQGSSFVDNLHSGGMIAILDLETGKIETNAANHLNVIYETHPDTGTVIKGFQIPYFEEAKKMIEKAGHGIEGFIGWDVAITENGPIIIEANGSPGADGLQIPYVPLKIGARYIIEKYL